jgi:2'-5' RNA ligase
MRLFVGVRPAEPVLDRVAELVVGLRGSLSSRSEDALRWVSRDQWHVTLRFLGEVDDAEPVVAAIEQAPLRAAEAVLGPRAKLLGREVVCVPTGGLEALALGVVEATATLGQPPEPRPFHGHLTLAWLRRRGRRGRPVRSRDLEGAAIDAHWMVDEVVLMRSRLGAGGPRYENLHVRSLR